MTRSFASTMRLSLAAAGTALREKLAYRFNYLGSMLTYAVFILVFSRIWANSVAANGPIAGYSYSMLVWYFIIAELPMFALGRFFWTLSRDMKSGQITYSISRPYDYAGYQYFERMGSAMPNLLLIGIEGFALGLAITGGLPAIPSLEQAGTAAGNGATLAAGTARIALVLVSLLLSGTLNFYLQFSISLTALWFEENDAFYWIYQKIALVVGTLIPIEFLPATVLRIAVWTPFPYVSYAPARIMALFSYGEAFRLIAFQLGWILVSIVIAKLVFAAGSKRISVNGG